MVPGGTNCEFDLQEGYTALLRGAAYGREDSVQLLIDAGADTNAKDNVRFITASWFACLVNRLHVRLFLMCLLVLFFAIGIANPTRRFADGRH